MNNIIHQNIYKIICDSIQLRKSGNFVFTKSNDYNVGIGTNSPAVGLHLRKIANAFFRATSIGSTGVSGFQFENDDQRWSTRIRGDVNNRYEIYDVTYGTAPLVINANTGNVGIGEPLPQYKIDVAGYGSFDNSVYLQSAPHIAVPDTLLALDGRLIKKTAVTSIYQYIDTNYASISDTTLWTLIPDTIAGDYKTGDYAAGDYLLASVDGYAIINKNSYNVKTTDNLSVKENLNVTGEIKSGGSAVSRWRGVLNTAPLTDVKEGDMYYQSTDEKVYIRANLNWKPLN